MFSYLTIPVNFSLPFRPHKHLNLHILLTLQTTRKTLPSYSPYPSDHTENFTIIFSWPFRPHRKFSWPFRPHRKCYHHILLTLQTTQKTSPSYSPNTSEPNTSEHTKKCYHHILLTLQTTQETSPSYSPNPSEHTDILSHHILLTYQTTQIFSLPFRPHR